MGLGLRIATALGVAILLTGLGLAMSATKWRTLGETYSALLGGVALAIFGAGLLLGLFIHWVATQRPDAP